METVQDTGSKARQNGPQPPPPPPRAASQPQSAGSKPAGQGIVRNVRPQPASSLQSRQDRYVLCPQEETYALKLALMLAITKSERQAILA